MIINNMPRPFKQKSEKEIQKDIIDYLRYSGFFVYKNSSVGIYKKATDSYIPAQTRGIADLTAIKEGRIYQIEVKKDGGKQSQWQKLFQDNWEMHGGVYILGGLDEVMKLVK